MMEKEQIDNVWEDLVVSLLSVNQYSLERTYASIDGLRSEGLTRPENLSTWRIEELVLRLKRAGCDRGEYMTHLFALRLGSLGQSLQTSGKEKCESILKGGNREAIQDILLPIKGIGPRVVENFFLLRRT